eukprot:SAG11_NODE_6548_length_1290_cov_2.379513_1_plen_99_part_00
MRLKIITWSLIFITWSLTTKFSSTSIFIIYYIIQQVKVGHCRPGRKWSGVLEAPGGVFEERTVRLACESYVQAKEPSGDIVFTELQTELLLNGRNYKI